MGHDGYCSIHSSWGMTCMDWEQDSQCTMQMLLPWPALIQDTQQNVHPPSDTQSAADGCYLCAHRYAKLKNAPYKVVSEKLGDNTYSVSYSFKTPEILADFQAW